MRVVNSPPQIVLSEIFNLKEDFSKKSMILKMKYSKMHNMFYTLIREMNKKYVFRRFQFDCGEISNFVNFGIRIVTGIKNFHEDYRDPNIIYFVSGDKILRIEMRESECWGKKELKEEKRKREVSGPERDLEEDRLPRYDQFYDNFGDDLFFVYFEKNMQHFYTNSVGGFKMCSTRTKKRVLAFQIPNLNSKTNQIKFARQETLIIR